MFANYSVLCSLGVGLITVRIMEDCRYKLRASAGRLIDDQGVK